MAGNLPEVPQPVTGRAEICNLTPQTLKARSLPGRRAQGLSTGLTPSPGTGLKSWRDRREPGFSSDLTVLLEGWCRQTAHTYFFLNTKNLLFCRIQSRLLEIC